MALDAEKVVYMVVEIIIGFLVVVTNGIVILTYIRTPRLHTVRNYFILSLTSADFLTGFAILPNAISRQTGLPKNFYGCQVVHCLFLAFAQISILNLLAWAIDRYIAIKLVTSYDKVLRPCSAIILIVGIWVVAILIGFMPVYVWQLPEPDTFLVCDFRKVIPLEFVVYMTIYVVQGLTFVSLIVLLIVMYRKLYKEMTLATEMLPFDDQEDNRRFKRELVAITFIVVVFIVCWIPLDVLNNLSLFRPDVSFPLRFLLFAILLSRARTFINPYFYAYGDMDLRKAIVRAVPLAVYIVPRIDDRINSFAEVCRYLSDNPVEIVSVQLSTPPKLQARDIVDEPVIVYEEPVVVPPPVIEEDPISDTGMSGPIESCVDSSEMSSFKSQ